MKYLFKIIYLFARIYWGLFRPKTSGSRVMMIRDGKILLVKHSYQNYWFFPGGGLKYGETYEEAARREMGEEAGAEGESLEFCGVYNSYDQSKSDSIALFFCDKFSFTGHSDGEIEEVRLFGLDELPPNLEPGCARRLEEYSQGKIALHGRW
ncbi:MAG: NUDIX domain-containing protein [Spirochaetales bacterium]|nr:NUDIX domain-containing protein [Spirochaetales bacterium]